MKRNKISLVVSGILFSSIAIATGSIFSSTYALVDLHIHEGNHYSEKAATSDTYGIKEYWICCTCHEHWISEPSVGSFTNAGTANVTLETSDDRYIAPLGEVVTAYNGYYSSLTSWTDGEDLKQQLHDIIRNGYQAIPYSNNYETNINADHSYKDFEYLDVIYGATDVFKSRTNIGYQREHCWPASLMTGVTTTTAVKTLGRATDFHNLWAADSSANSSRGNKNYGNASTYVDRTTDSGNDGYKYDVNNFEPGNKDKGKVARSIFYMATMYKDDEYKADDTLLYKGLTIQEDYVTHDASNPAYAIGNLSHLLSWNSYPVDYQEMQHNESVYSHVYSETSYAQGNRNPYVDFPELVDYVYGSKKDQAGTLASLTPSIDSLGNTEHYALESSIREGQLSTTFTDASYSVVKVNNDFTTTKVTSGVTHSLNGHTFTTSDGDEVTATVSIGEFSYSYKIVLNPMAQCSYFSVMSKDGIDKTKNGTDDPEAYSSVNYGGKDFTFYFEATSGEKTTITNDNTNGGFKIGSGTYKVSKVIIKTVESYTVDMAYIKAFAANTSSSYKLTIKVGDTILISNQTVSYNNKQYAVYGGQVATPLTGQVEYIFEGTQAIQFHSIAFNAL